MSREWIGVDLDGTLARYDGWVEIRTIGEPVPEMVERVKRWIAEGKEVRIFTARVSEPDPWLRSAFVAECQSWLLKNIGKVLPITNIKDLHMAELYDDRAVQVEKNTGKILGHSTRGFA